MARIIAVTPVDGFKLSLQFEDGTSGTVPLHDRLFGPVFEPLRDASLFRQVFVDDFGAVAWPNGADLAPDGLYERLKNSQPDFSKASSS